MAHFFSSYENSGIQNILYDFFHTKIDTRKHYRLNFVILCDCILYNYFSVLKFI